MSEISFEGSAGSATYNSTACNFTMVSDSNQLGNIIIGLPPTDNWILMTRFTTSNSSNLSFIFADNSNSIKTDISQLNSNIRLSSNNALITSCNFTVWNNSNYELAIRRRFGNSKLYINDVLMYDHTTPFTFDEETGNFTISGASKSNEVGTLSVDDVEITQITTETDMTEFTNDVKMTKLYCDSIETTHVMEGGCNLSQKYQLSLEGSNVSFPNLNVMNTTTSRFAKIDNTNNSLSPSTFWNNYPLAIRNSNSTSGTFTGLCFVSTNMINGVDYTPGAAITFQRISSFSQGNLNFHTKGGNGNITNCDVRMTLNSNGHLGINTQTPTYPLHVNGNAYATGFVENGTALASKYAPLNTFGNFGQIQAHTTYNNFNTYPAYWGWNHVAGTLNAPNNSAAQWYREVCSLGAGYHARGILGFRWNLPILETIILWRGVT